MIFKPFKRKSDKEFQDVFFGDNAYSLKISKHYKTEEDDQGMVLIFPKGSECITLRIDVLSYVPKDEHSAHTGYDGVIQKTNPDEKNLYFENDLAIAFSESTSIEDGTDIILKLWEIGPKSYHVIIMTATILAQKQHDKRVKKLLAAIPEIIQSITPTEKHHHIATSSGTVNYTMQTQHPQARGEQQIRELNDTEQQFTETWFEHGNNIIRYYQSSYESSDLTFELLDTVFSEWINDIHDEKFDDESIANGLGVVYGMLLSKQLHMKWVKVNDKYGENFAITLANTPLYQNLTTFPIAAVYKRIETGETGFFANIYEVLKHRIATEE